MLARRRYEEACPGSGESAIQSRQNAGLSDERVNGLNNAGYAPPVIAPLFQMIDGHGLPPFKGMPILKNAKWAAVFQTGIH
jgi:hypothetical protein